ncbi:MAG: hypothetical protein U0326_07280 [Polyangiales bacterium]
MIPHVVMLQPMGGAVEAPSTTPVVAQSPSDGGPGGGPQIQINFPPPPPPGPGVTQEVCEKANSEATLATLGYGLGASLFALVIFVALEKKLVGSGGLRIAIATAIGAAVAGALAYFDPGRGDTFQLCLNDSSMALYISFGTQPIARALAYGFAPALVLTLVLCVIAKRLV